MSADLSPCDAQEQVAYLEDALESSHNDVEAGWVFSLKEEWRDELTELRRRFPDLDNLEGC